MKQNKNSQVTIRQRCYHIFTKDVSNFQQHLPRTILRQKFRSNGREGNKGWREDEREKKKREKENVDFCLVENSWESVRANHWLPWLPKAKLETKENKIIFRFLCFIIFFILPRTNAGVYLTFRLFWSLRHHHTYSVGLLFPICTYVVSFSSTAILSWIPY